MDADPVTFAYGGQSWDSNDSRCSVGAYDRGTREMDCRWECNQEKLKTLWKSLRYARWTRVD
jgi:hypothetical protein